MKTKNSTKGKLFLFFFLLIAFLFITCKDDTKPPPPPPVVDDVRLTSDPYFLHISDIHLSTTAQSIRYGHDTDMRLWDSTKVKIKSILNGSEPPQFVIYTGDLSAHYSCHDLPNDCSLPVGNPKRIAHNNNIEAVLNDMRSLVAAKKIPLYYLPGNNDALAGDYFSFTDKDGKTPFSKVTDPQNPYPALNTNIKCGSPPCLVSNVHPTMGYYSARPIDSLRIIALNSIILGHRYNEQDDTTQLDAGSTQMKWLGKQLNEAKKVGDRVYIAMHIPPGRDAYAIQYNKTNIDKKTINMWAHLPSKSNSWQNDFLAKMDTFQNIISGILYGHTHMEEVRRLYDPNGTAITEVAISAPGITPQHYNNPGFKAVYFDNKNKELTDFITYYTTPVPATWGEYQFSKKYGCAGKTIYDCLSKMDTSQINQNMDKIYTVMNGAPDYPTNTGIEVVTGQ